MVRRLSTGWPRARSGPEWPQPGYDRPIAYSYVDDINATLQSLLDARAVPNEEPTDVGGGMLRASVTDADGNVIDLVQPPKSNARTRGTGRERVGSTEADIN